MKTFVPNDRRLWSLRHAEEVWATQLVFDLHAISKGIEDEIVFDDSGNEGAAAVRVAKIDPGPGTDGRFAPDDPIPGRGLGRDPVRLLEGASADYKISIQDDVMHGLMGRAPSLDPVAAHAETVDGDIADDDVARINDLDGSVSLLASDHCTRAFRRAGDGYTTTGLAVEVGDGQSGISAGYEQQSIAGP
jgi:hypothetical protein